MFISLAWPLILEPFQEKNCSNIFINILTQETQLLIHVTAYWKYIGESLWWLLNQLLMRVFCVHGITKINREHTLLNLHRFYFFVKNLLYWNVFLIFNVLFLYIRNIVRSGTCLLQYLIWTTSFRYRNNTNSDQNIPGLNIIILGDLN